MSGKLKRKLDEDDDGARSQMMEEMTPSRGGRVRKKSAKVLEMEEVEELERKQTKVTKKGRPSGGSDTGGSLTTIPETPKMMELPSPGKGKLPGKALQDSLKLKLGTIIDNAQKSKSAKKTISTEPKGLKLKLVSSPTSEGVPNFVAKPSEEDVEVDDEEKPDVKVLAKSPEKVKKRTKKGGKNVSPKTASSELLSQLKKPIHDSDEDEEGELIIDTKETHSSKKKKSSKKIKVEPDSEFGEESSSQEDVPHYSDTQHVALKLKTSSEKKAYKTKKPKKDKPKKEEEEKPKKKRAMTAYMLWCNSMRNKVTAQNPGIEFAQISKRLGEIWHGLPEKEKMTWKKKAKKMSSKGSTLISTGKTLPSKPQSLPLNKRPADKVDSRIPQPPVPAAKLEQIADSYRVSGVGALDVAAHLKLLGESLSIIGARLQDHKGPIAVQGTLPVLLDSLMCAMAPLMCLTNQVEELNNIPPDTLSKMLDNIAHIMPVG